MSIEVYKRETTTNSMHIKRLVLLPQTQLRCWQGTSAGKQTQTRTHSHHLWCEFSKKSLKLGVFPQPWQVQAIIGLSIRKHCLYTVADKRVASYLHSLTARSFQLVSPRFHSLQKKTRAKIIVRMETEGDARGAAWLTICSVMQTPIEAKLWIVTFAYRNFKKCARPL